jgi:hypothetical protein
MSEINMPIGGGPGNGNGGGCKPGVILERLSLDVNPPSDSAGQSFVAVGTHITLFGSAQVRRWFPDCTSRVTGAPIQWELFYQPVGSQPTDVTSILQGGQSSNMNAFDAGLPGVYNLSLVCPIVAAVAGRTIYVGSVFNLDGTAKVWVKNDNPMGDIIKFEEKMHAVLIILPQNGQVLLRMNPIQTQQRVTITQELGEGFFDSTTGRLDLHLVLNASGQISGTTDITISTEKTIIPPQDNSVSGQRRDSSGQIALVGDAPIVGPPYTTHGWIEIDDGKLTPV